MKHNNKQDAPGHKTTGNHSTSGGMKARDYGCAKIKSGGAKPTQRLMKNNT